MQGWKTCIRSGCGCEFAGYSGHSFCSRTCADRWLGQLRTCAEASGADPAPPPPPGSQCARQGCSRPCWPGEAFCSRTCDDVGSTSSDGGGSGGGRGRGSGGTGRGAHNTIPEGIQVPSGVPSLSMVVAIRVFRSILRELYERTGNFPNSRRVLAKGNKSLWGGLSGN